MRWIFNHIHKITSASTRIWYWPLHISTTGRYAQYFPYWSPSVILCYSSSYTILVFLTNESGRLSNDDREVPMKMISSSSSPMSSSSITISRLFPATVPAIGTGTSWGLGVPYLFSHCDEIVKSQCTEEIHLVSILKRFEWFDETSSSIITSWQGQLQRPLHHALSCRGHRPRRAACSHSGHYSS